MKTKETLKMEQALINYELKRYHKITLEVPFWHTTFLAQPQNYQAPDYPPMGQVGHEEDIDAVIEQNGIFTCYELKVSMSDLHSRAAQSYVGHYNYLVCPIALANKIKETSDSWLSQHSTVGILAWDGKDKFKTVRHAKYQQVMHNDAVTLYQGMLTRAFVDIRMYRNQLQKLKKVD